MESDTTFSKLLAILRRQIDEAFNTACGASDSESTPHPQKRRVSNSASKTAPAGFIVDDTQAGFLLDDSTEDQPGGSVVSGDGEHDLDPATSTEKPTCIPLSRIPAALQLLDLQPDDEEVLAVFRNAASGWTSRSPLDLRQLSPNEEGQEQTVSRDDWRAVCAVLLEPNSADLVGQGEDEGVHIRDDDYDIEPDPESDEYQYEDEPYADESSDEDEDGSDEEYLEERRKSGTKSKSARSALASSSPAPSHETPRKLTSRQILECRRAFALFFPDIPVDSEELDGKKIMIKDITRVAKILKEKIKAEEIVEMLEAFSTSKDKAMNLADFERMMIVAKMA